MGSRDRPHKEAKKKPKAKSAQPSLSPMSEPPQNVEVIRKPRPPASADPIARLANFQTQFPGRGGDPSSS